MKTLRILSVFLICLFIAGWSWAAAPLPPLKELPLGDRWFSISLNDERTGFAHETISKTADGYRISSDSSVRMTVLGFSRDAAIKERYLIRQDLTLVSFSVEQILDGSPMKLTGERVPEGIRLTVENAGGTTQKTVKAKGPVYPPPALNFYPLLKGFTVGRKYRLVMFDPEEQKTKEVVITAVGMEVLPGGIDAIHLRNDLYTMVDNDVWVDRQGNTLKESVRDDLIVTQAEDAASAARFLTDSALAKKDLVFDFSLVPALPPIHNPEKLRKLVVQLSGWPEDLGIPDGARQQVTARSGHDITVTLAPDTSAASPKPLDDAERLHLLGTTQRIIPQHPQIRSLVSTIVGEEKDPAKVATLLADWVASNIEGSVTDSQSPVETLKIRTGNCQSHARLYASLARAAGIPTRFVSGLVYLKGKGFLYHSWAESYVGYWLPVDPTFGQVPADLTHIRLFDGDQPSDLAPLVRIIGRLSAKVLTQDYDPPASP